MKAKASVNLWRSRTECVRAELIGDGGAGGQSCRQCLAYGGRWQVRTALRVRGGAERQHAPCMNHFGVSNYWWIKA